MGVGIAFLIASFFGMEALDKVLPPDAPIIHTLSNGDLLEEQPGAGCPSPEPTNGCVLVRAVDGEPEGSAKRYYIIRYPAGAEGHHTRLHEVGHAVGGRHGEWEPHGSGRACAQVTESGRSGWKVGEYVCTQYQWADTAPMSPHEQDVRQAKTGVAELH